MSRNAVLPVLALVVALLAACSQEGDRASTSTVESAPFVQAPAMGGRQQAPVKSAATTPAAPPAEKALSDQAATTPTAYIAYRHFLRLEFPREAVPLALQTASADCQKLGAECQVIHSALSRPTADAPARGKLQIRIAPGRVNVFRQSVVDKAGIMEDRSEAEDKTSEVIDVEARQKNKTALRDRLRQLMTLPNAKVEDLIELETQLANVQSELDALAGRRKALANETEKVFMDFELLPRLEHIRPGSFNAIERAFKSVASNFASSVAALITFLAVVAPWLLVLWIPVWLLRRLWRRWRASKQAA